MIQWTDGATKDLDQAYDYITLNNSEAVAKGIRERVIEVTQQLDAFPMSGRTGRVPDTRELAVSDTPFIVAYAIDVDRTVILAVYHGAQRWPEAF